MNIMAENEILLKPDDLKGLLSPAGFGAILLAIFAWRSD